MTRKEIGEYRKTLSEIQKITKKEERINELRKLVKIVGASIYA